jgi:streptomycin 6-kinase
MTFCLISIHHNNISDNNRSSWPIIRKRKSVHVEHGYQVGVICSSDLKV